MIILGIILLVVGFAIGMRLLYVLGCALALIGVLLLVLHAAGPVYGGWY